MYNILDRNFNEEVFTYMKRLGFLKENPTIDYTYFEIDLQELNLDYNHLLTNTLDFLNKIKPLGWRQNNQESPNYKCVGLTYNPYFKNPTENIFYQYIGANDLKQSTGKHHGGTYISNTRDTYYDTGAFNAVHPLTEFYYGDLFKKIKGSVLRSRVAVIYPEFMQVPNDLGWHVDEPPFDLMRINIPLQTSSEYVIQIKGQDEFGNSLEKEFIPQVGKMYIWNTRIMHRATCLKKNSGLQPRINMVLGFNPYLNFADNIFYHNENYGKSLKDLIQRREIFK